MNRLVALSATALISSALLIALPCSAFAQGAQQEIDEGRAMVRAGFRSLIQEEIPMTEQERAAFWPVYDEYEHAVTAIMDRYSRLVSDYVDLPGLRGILPAEVGTGKRDRDGVSSAMSPLSSRTLRYARAWATGPHAFEEEELVLDREGVAVPATVVRPVGPKGSTPAWVVMHGLTRPGRAHAQLVRFTRAVASAGLTTIVPEVPEWRRLRLSPGLTTPTIEAAVRGRIRSSGPRPRSELRTRSPPWHHRGCASAWPASRGSADTRGSRPPSPS